MATLHPLYFSSNVSTRPDIRDTTGTYYRFTSSTITSVGYILISQGGGILGYTNTWADSLTAGSILKIANSSNTVIASFTVANVTPNLTSPPSPYASDNYYTRIGVTNPQGSIPSNGQLTNLFVPVTANAAATLNSRFTISSDLQKLKSAVTTLTSAFTITPSAAVSSLGYVERDYVTDGYFGILWLGYADLTSTSTVAATLNRIVSATVSVNSTSTVTASADKSKNVASDLTARFTVTAAADRSRSGNSNLTTKFSLVTNATVLKSAAIAISSTANLTALAAKSSTATCNLASKFALSAVRSILRPVSAALTSTVTVTALASVIKNTALSAVSRFTLATTPSVTKTTSASMTARATFLAVASKTLHATATLQAFNTIVSVSARIRSNPADLAVRTTLAATCIRIISASVIEPPAYAFNGNNAITSNQVGSGWSLPQGFGGGWTVAFSIRKGPDIIGKIFSSYETDNSFNIGVTDVGLYIQATNTTPNIPGVRVITLEIANYTWNSNWHQVLIKINQWATPISGGSDLDNVSSADFYVDGQLIGSRSETNTDNLDTQSGAAYLNIVDPYYIGENLDAAVRQLWIGETPTNFTASDWYPGHYQDLGSVGTIGYTQTLPIPLIYNQFLDSDYIRNWNSKFTLVAKGDNTVFADASIAARFSLSATCVRTKSNSFTNTARFTLTVNPYNFTKAQTVLTSRAALSASIGYLRNSTATLLAKAQLTAAGIRQVNAQATVRSAFNIQATSRIITLINADLVSRFTLVADGRLQARVRATAALSTRFALTSTAVVTRRGQTTVTTRANLVATAIMIRRGVVSLLAFASELSTARRIEINKDYIITVAQETNLFWTDDASSPHILVPFENGVNTVTADATGIAVQNETGQFLAQQL